MYGIYAGDGFFNFIQGGFRDAVNDVRCAVTFTAVSTTFFDEFGDENWQYTRRNLLFRIVNNERGTVDPVCRNIFGTVTLCCYKTKLYTVHMSDAYTCS